ncbi:MAG: putative lipid II flippase FtsW [Candidatus Latescibacteria bacterium]|nr:putative lipid II flippase FtsW [Candidatus Latescibacterota bacterium]
MNVAIAVPRRLDWGILLPVVALLALGLVMVYSSSALLGADRFHSQFFFLKRQVVRLLLGLVVMLALSQVDYRRLLAIAPWALGASVALLATLVVLGGVGVRGANRWLSVAEFTLQPTEVARVACVVYLAKLLDRKGDRVRSFRDGVLPAAVVLGVIALLILKQPNLGSTIALLVTGGLMLHLAGARHRHLAVLAGAGALFAGIQILRHRYMMDRVQGWLSHWLTGDAQGTSWQLHQSIVALGSGGVLGEGPGRGLQKFFFLPDPHTDFIYAVIGEELGFVGAASVLVVYAVLFLRGLKIAGRAPDRFGFYLASGLTLSLAVYVGMNLSVVTGIIPTTGLPLPFLSYGGSALVVNLGVVGVLLNVASQIKSGIRTGPVVGTVTRKRPGGR